MPVELRRPPTGGAPPSFPDSPWPPVPKMPPSPLLIFDRKLVLTSTSAVTFSSRFSSSRSTDAWARTLALSICGFSSGRRASSSSAFRLILSSASSADRESPVILSSASFEMDPAITSPSCPGQTTSTSRWRSRRTRTRRGSACQFPTPSHRTIGQALGRIRRRGRRGRRRGTARLWGRCSRAGTGQGRVRGLLRLEVVFVPFPRRREFHHRIVGVEVEDKVVVAGGTQDKPPQAGEGVGVYVGDAEEELAYGEPGLGFDLPPFGDCHLPERRVETGVVGPLVCECRHVRSSLFPSVFLRVPVDNV